jgi:archaellum component FlaF (FlaF/FlaG flagellin family)
MNIVKRISQLLILVLVLIAVPGWSATYYAASNGSGTVCSLESPGTAEYTIQTKAANGDTVYLRGGMHNLASTITITGKRLNVYSYPGESVWINVPSGQTAFKIDYGAASGTVVYGDIAVTGGDSSAWAVRVADSTNVKLKYKVIDFLGSILSASGTANISIEKLYCKNVARNISVQTGSTVIIDFLEMWEAGNGYFYALNNNGGTVTVNSYLVVGGLQTEAAIRNQAGTMVVNNGIQFAPGMTTKHAPALKQVAGTLIANNCILMGAMNSPWSNLTNGTVTLNNCQSNIMPGLQSYGYGKAIATFYAVDSNHITTGSIAQYQRSADRAGVHITYFPDDTDQLNDSQKSVLRTFVAAGHDLGVEGKSSSRLDKDVVMTLQYNGVASNPVVAITNNGQRLSFTSSNSLENFTMDLGKTSPVYHIGDALVPTLDAKSYLIAALANYGTADYDDTYSYCLADQVIDLSDGQPHDIILDRLGRFFFEEINASKSDLENVIGGSYSCKSYLYPRYAYDADAKNAIKAAGYKIALAAKDQLPQLTNITDIFYMRNSFQEVWTNIKGTGFDGLDAAGKEIRMRGSARAWAIAALRYGYWGSFLLLENGAAATEDELYWFMDELKKCGVMVLSFAEAQSWLESNAVMSNDSYSLPLTQTYNGNLLSTSPAINAGYRAAFIRKPNITDMADKAVTTAYGEFVRKNFDIGPYQFSQETDQNQTGRIRSKDRISR